MDDQDKCTVFYTNIMTIQYIYAYVLIVGVKLLLTILRACIRYD